jgi:hypothetical protein
MASTVPLLHELGMILGYPSAPSVSPGETLFFHVSTDAPEFRIEVYRQGATLSFVAATDWIAGERSPLLAPWDDWSRVWRGHPFTVPESCPSGAYIAMFVEGDGTGRERDDQALDRATADGREGKALFVVRSAAPGRGARILYKIPLFTYCAYNAEGDPRGSLYTWPGRRVTLHRPGNGTGGTPWDAFAADVYDPSSPRQVFAHWDAKMIRWLEANGYEVDYATDLDLHRRRDLLAHYQLLLSVGHDEYWSAPLREHVQAFVDGGGNVAFFSGNVCYWRIHVDEDDASLTIEKGALSEERLACDAWRRTLPENVLTGVSYANAGGHWNGPRPSNGGYTVARARHWVFADTGLGDGDTFGEREAVVGYEADGAAFTGGPGGVPIPTGQDGTPLDFVILATASLAGWEGAMRGPLSAATMGLYAHRGIVFTAASVDWPRVLDAGEPVVDRITRNVLARLAARAVRVSGPFPTRCGHTAAIEGEPGTFYADTSALPPSRVRSYRWSISAGSAGPLDDPSLAVTMPSPVEPVTVSVVIDIEGDPVGAFGTLTVLPYTRAELLWQQMRCEADAIARDASLHDRSAACNLPAPRDPLAPIFQRPERPPETRVVRAIHERAQHLADLSRRLLDLVEKD